MRVLTCLVLALGACGAPVDDDDDLGAALPTAEALHLGLPGGQGKPTLGEPAELWVLAQRVAGELNGTIGDVVGLVERFAAGQPGDDGRSPLIYRLVIARRPDGGVGYHLDARPRAGGVFQTIVSGAAAADGHAGVVRLELARIAALDPAADFGGAEVLTVGYDLGPGGAKLALARDTAQYRYALGPDGAGALELAGDGGAIRARWLASGAGRAEVAGALVQCWDDAFRLVFAAAPGRAIGDPSACADVR